MEHLSCHFGVAGGDDDAGHQLRPIPSTWGHAAGRGTNPAYNLFIDTALRELLT